MIQMLTGTAVSEASYSATLRGWASRPVQPGVQLDADARYSCAASPARETLTGGTNQWLVTDGGAGACASVPPVDFGNVQVGAAQQRIVEVSNPGGRPVDLIAVTVSQNVSLSDDTCSRARLDPGTSCTVTLGFTPAEPGTLNASLSVTSSALTSPDTATVTGQGAPPSVEVAPRVLDFGDIQTGSVSEPLVATVTNTGVGPVTVGSVADAPSFAATSDCALLPAAATCSIRVRLRPQAVGTIAEQLTVGTSAGDIAVAVSGRGMPNPTPSPTATTTPASKIQRLKDGLPKRIKRAGITVITPAGARTTAGQSVRTRISGQRAIKTRSGPARLFTTVRGPDGQLSIRTYGRPLRTITVTQSAPAVTQYRPLQRQGLYRAGRLQR